MQALTSAVSELCQKPGLRTTSATSSAGYYSSDEDEAKEERAPVAKAAIGVWKDLALRCFRSDKLSVRRYGLEQVGQLARSPVTLTQEELTQWVKEERVLADLFGERLDDRVIEVTTEPWAAGCFVSLLT